MTTPDTSTTAPGPFEVEGRPAPAPRAPPRGELLAVYVELLAIEQERLRVAVRIERERGFVFPETTVILRDVRWLAERVYGSGEDKGGREAEPSDLEAEPEAEGEPSPFDL